MSRAGHMTRADYAVCMRILCRQAYRMRAPEFSWSAQTSPTSPLAAAEGAVFRRAHNLGELLRVLISLRSSLGVKLCEEKNSCM